MLLYSCFVSNHPSYQVFHWEELVVAQSIEVGRAISVNGS